MNMLEFTAGQVPYADSGQASALSADRAERDPSIGSKTSQR
jgi:hypothetical protein